MPRSFVFAALLWPALVHAELGLDLEAALRVAQDAAGSVRGAALAVQAQQLRAESLSNLAGPSVSVTGLAAHLRGDINIDTSGLAADLNPLIGGLHLPVPPVPNTTTIDRSANVQSLGLSGVWPLYTGGRLEAIQAVAAARVGEAQAERQEAEDQSATTTAQRYFQLQLARHAERARSAAVAGIADHQQAASKLERTGLIARAERLRADVALDEARRDWIKAQSDVQLAQVALRRQLALEEDVVPHTPLFVHSQPVGSLQDFIELGRAHHPAWTKLASKRAQADGAVALQSAPFTPMVMALGGYSAGRLNSGPVQPGWNVGLVVSVPLVSRIDHAKAADAAKLDRLRVDEATDQARRDVPTLIEQQWRALENARAQFASSASSLALAHETLRLQQTAFAHQQATPLDVTTAQLQLTKTEVERAQQAYDYVLALARLLEACGASERLGQYARTADVQLNLP